MKTRKIYEKNFWYHTLKYYIDRCTRHSYSRIEVRGKENIPTDGAVILAGNHCNTLMDALVVLQAFKDETVFGARADMFNKPLLAKIMFFLRILPMVRQRDGLRNVLKNYESIDTITETLEHGVRFCMFPEGRHRPARSLLPLGKGIFRAAFNANSRLEGKKPVYIVPVGLEYGDYFRYRSTCLISFGKPLNVTEFISKIDVGNEAQLMEPLKNELRSRMSELITYINDGEEYKDKWALTRILARDDARRGNLQERMHYNRYVIEQIEKACEKDPPAMAELLQQAGEFDVMRRKKNYSIWSFGKGNTTSGAIGKGAIAMLGIPYFIFAAIISLPMWVTFEILRRKLRDRAFHNTAGFGIKAGMGPLVFLLWTILAFCLTPWYIAVLLSLLTIPSYGFFYDYTEFLRIYLSDLKLLKDRKASRMFEKIQQRFSEI